MNAAQAALNTAAHNIANSQTAGFSRQQTNLTTQEQGGVLAATSNASVPGAALESDLVSQLQAKNAFLANLAVFKTQDRMAGALLNLSA